MKERLSTSMTFFWKFVFPTIWIGGFGTGTFLAIWKLGLTGIPALAGLALGCTIIYYGCIRAKNVSIDNDYLYVDNFLRTIKVPLANISDISENVLFSPRPIFIEFKEETEFGKSIMFIGYTQTFSLFSSHPAVKELRGKLKKQLVRGNEHLS